MLLARAVHLVLLGLFGAAIVHIVILFLLPVYSERDVWSRLAAASDLYTPLQLDGAKPRSGLPGFDDTFFREAACRFDLSEGAVRITAGGPVPFWSMSIYDRDGLNVFSLNDRSASGNRLDVAIVTPAQMLEIRKTLTPELEQSVFAEADIAEGIAVTRVFVPDESWQGTATAFLDGIACEPL